MLRTLVSRFIVSRFIIARFHSTVQGARPPHIPRARAPYTVCRYGDFIFITFFPSCFWSKAEQILFWIEF